ncbi:MAG: hypothetical protein HYT13_01825 [Candidatus Liptonbacteria bacterium]|nr:hypothetical protein [Candidatus Liptonbacteria bacterium]
MVMLTSGLKAKSYKLKAKGGYITLLMVIIVGAIGVATGVSLLLLGVGSSRSSLSFEKSNQAKALSNACAEAALDQIRNSSAFSGSAGLTFGRGSCSYQVLNLGGQSRLINASGTVDEVVRKIKITLNQITPKINLTSWQEVSDF